MARTSIATDNFNRAGPAIGSDWDTTLNVSNGGNITIDSSTRITGGFSNFSVDEYHADARWVGAGSFTDDQYSSLKMVLAMTGAVGSQYMIGVIARASSDTNASRDYYMALVKDSSPTTTILAKVVNGTYTQLGSSTAVSWAANDRIEIECEGTTIRLCKNGSAIGGALTVTDSSISTGTPGVAVNANLYGDDWEGGTVAAASAAITTRALLLGTGH